MRARFRRREVAPAFVFSGQLVMELFQNFMLETAAFARVQLEFFPLLGAQAGMNKETERALRKFLQPADRRFQNRAVNFFGEGGRKSFRFLRLAQLRQFFRKRLQRGNFEQFTTGRSAGLRSGALEFKL